MRAVSPLDFRIASLIVITALVAVIHSVKLT
jgi:hypothetical protein